MKKNLKIILIVLFGFVFGSIQVLAECITGFACSINMLEDMQIKQNIKTVANINNYFEKTVNENFFFDKKLVQINYNDLFLFNTIV